MKLIADKVSVDSSMVNSLTHVVAADILIAEFTNGDKYMYSSVTESTFKQITEAESVGKEFNKVIKKGGFLYHKI